ncbi:MAG: hypothetical protein AAB855_00715, partial [Patescibacteria group bacterium]
VYGINLSLYQKTGTELSDITQLLELHFGGEHIDPDDREHHASCALHPKIETKDSNPNSGARYNPEKMIIRWDPGRLITFREVIEPVVNRLYTLQYSRNQFWNSVERASGRVIDVEIQLETHNDYLDFRLVGGDENHRTYKSKQASRTGSEVGARSILERIRPPRIYGIHWNRQHIQVALYKKTLAEIGIHSAALKLFGEEE